MVFHSYLTDGENARLWHSCSLFRDNKTEANKVSIANRGLHWHDIKMFKKKGYSMYDWGGISDYECPNGIDMFKMGFGGEFIAYFNATIPIGIIGRVYLTISRITKKLKS